MRNPFVPACAVATALSLVFAGAVASRSADPTPRTTVLLNGRVATLTAASRSHCDDLTPGVLRCYSSQRNRDRAASPRVSRDATAASAGYVVAYVDISFGGASVVLSQDHPDLRTIGWNNRISSYKVYTSLTGYFHQGAYYAGSAQSYCCFSQVSYVGNSFNDTFSSFSLP